MTLSHHIFLQMSQIGGQSNFMKTNEKGFTLIELLISISLLAITAGLTTDIILSLVRTYNKTRITNEIEQAGTIAMSKMEKELRVALELIHPSEGVCDSVLVFQRKRTSDEALITVTYQIQTSGNTSGSLIRIEDDGAAEVAAPVLDSTQVNGIKLEDSSEFCVLNQTQPHVVMIDFNLLQAANTGGVSFQGSVPLEQTIVLRGTY